MTMRPEYPVCAFCGNQSADRYIQGRRAMICGNCAARADSPSRSVAGSCVLCGRLIGTTRGVFRRRPVVAALIIGTAIACMDCLSSCREFLAEDQTHAEKR